MKIYVKFIYFYSFSFFSGFTHVFVRCVDFTHIPASHKK